MPEQPRFSTARLLLRPLTVGDAPRVQELVSEGDVARFTANIPHPYPAGGAEAWIGHHLASGSEGSEQVWAITTAQDGLVGSMGLRVDAPQSRAELGYWIGKPYWGKGYATDAGAALIEYGFLSLNLNRIFAHHMRRNPASGRVLQKLGMRYEGSLRQHFQRDGQYEDMECYGILRAEYPRHSGPS